jgi:hypothetical protein
MHMRSHGESNVSLSLIASRLLLTLRHDFVHNMRPCTPPRSSSDFSCHSPCLGFSPLASFLFASSLSFCSHPLPSPVARRPSPSAQPSPPTFSLLPPNPHHPPSPSSCCKECRSVPSVPHLRAVRASPLSSATQHELREWFLSPPR